MTTNNVKKIPGLSTIVVNGMRHTFAMDDSRHPAIKRVLEEMTGVQRAIRNVGYQPDTSWVLQDLPKAAKEEKLCRHSEKLAITYGLLSTPAHTPLRVIKNLRMCGDCHNATKAIAKAYQREITVRDASRFHQFHVNGECSCGEYY